MTPRRGLLPLSLAVSVSLSACVTSRPPPASPPPAPQAVPPAPPLPAGGNAQEIPDAIPRVEPRSRYGNPPFYDVMGKRYYVLSSSSAYVERGVASWYGPGFHQVRTSSGDTYDMYGMTAAHKTLPLPAYARVTNLQNGRTCVVRINDRGPFVGNRIIDLSYSAAAKLDMLRDGTAMVEVRVIDPAVPVPETLTAGGPVTPSAAPPAAAAPIMNGAPVSSGSVNGTPTDSAPAVPSIGAALAADSTLPLAPPANLAPPARRVAIPSALFVQAGAFADPANAQRLATRLRSGDYGKIFVREDLVAGRKLFRVRIGPVPNVPEFDRIVAALEQAGVHDAHLAMD